MGVDVEIAVDSLKFTTCDGAPLGIRTLALDWTEAAEVEADASNPKSAPCRGSIFGIEPMEFTTDESTGCEAATGKLESGWT